MLVIASQCTVLHFAGAIVTHTAISSGVPIIAFYNISISGADSSEVFATPGLLLISNNFNSNYPTLLIDTTNFDGTFTISSVFFSAYPPNGVMPSVAFGSVQ